MLTSAPFYSGKCFGGLSSLSNTDNSLFVHLAKGCMPHNEEQNMTCLPSHQVHSCSQMFLSAHSCRGSSLAHHAGSWVQKLNEAGFSVCGIDNQGAGR